MRFGAHLPLAAFKGRRATGPELIEFAEAAEHLGYGTLCANDHLFAPGGWIDPLVALGLVAARTTRVGLMTTAALLPVRGAAPLGAALASLQELSGGRLRAAVTPGSSPADYLLVGRDFESRWSQFDAEMPKLRKHFETAGVEAPPVWVASWGSPAGLRRAARLGDGWLASAYHGNPEHLREALAALPAGFPVALATTYLFITDDRKAAAAALSSVISPAGAPEDLQDRLLIGTEQECVERLRRIREAGVDEVFVWPVRDEVPQLRLFAERVAPELG